MCLKASGEHGVSFSGCTGAGVQFALRDQMR